jgi:hypothetical protein
MLNGFVHVADGRVLPRGDGMIHGAPLSPDQYMMDGCREYNLPHDIDNTLYLVDLIGVPHEWPVSFVQMTLQVFNYLLSLYLNYLLMYLLLM